MSNDVTLFGDLALSDEQLDELNEVNKRLSGGGDSVRRISIRGGKFREILGGEEVETIKDALNVVVINAAPVARMYYEGTYSASEPGVPPKCWSADTQKPAPEVPEENRMATKCADCPKNIKGSGQGDTRACRFSQRIAVVRESDLGNKDPNVYQLQLPATSVFGEVKDKKMPMQAYAKFLAGHKTPALAIVTQAYFDEDSDVPKLFFKPVRPLEKAELDKVLVLKDAPDTQRIINLTVSQNEQLGHSDVAAPAEEEKEETPEVPETPEKGEQEEEEEPKKMTRSRRKKAPAEEETPSVEDDSGLSDLIDSWDD